MTPFGKRGRLERLPPSLRPFVQSLLDPLRRLLALGRGFLGRLRPRSLGATYRWGRDCWQEIARRRRQEGLTVAVDIGPLFGPLTGVGWFLYRLLVELSQREDLNVRLYGPWMVAHPDDEQPAVSPPRGSAIETVTYAPPENLALPRDFLVRWLRRFAFLLVAADRNRVLFAPNYFLPPHFRGARGKLVVAVYDLSVRRFPWTMEERTYRALSANLDRSLERATAVMTISETVKEELRAEGVDARVRAVYPGPGHLSDVAPSVDEIPAPVPSRFALHVGTREPRKNLALLLEAWERLERWEMDLSLVLCGSPGWKSEALRRSMDRGRDEGWLIDLGYTTDAALAALYGRAFVVVCPSLYEGFGLPLVEAMLAGTPLVCSDIPVFREVAGEAALYAPPDRADLWVERLKELERSAELRERLRREGKRRVDRFDWRKTAEETVDLWRSAAAGEEIG